MRDSGAHLPLRTLVALLALGVHVPARAAAQIPESSPGVELGLLYEGVHRPTLALAPFKGIPGSESAATQAEAIVRRDLLYSGRFRMAEAPPQALVAMEELDYRLWDRVGIDYLVRGQIERAEGGLALYVEIHDIVYGKLLAVRRAALPGETSPGFRMAVHEASDAVVEHVFDEPGMAASRIAFAMRSEGSGTKDLYLVDSDGENLRRVSRHEVIISPSWHPAGDRILFNSLGTEPAIFEVNLRSGAERQVGSLGEGQPNAPTYLPNGDHLAASLDVAGRSRIVRYDLSRGCCATAITSGRAQDLSPSFSADGRWLAFTSNRLGAPLVFVQPLAGGEAELVSPYILGEPADFTAPDWSPRGGLLAYHGRIGRGPYQILVTEFGERAGRTRQLTDDGNSEAPSWAPDGRHLVFVAQRSEGSGLFVLDTTTREVRRLVAAREVSTPSWSPSLATRRP